MPCNIGLRCSWWCDNLLKVNVTSLFERKKKKKVQRIYLKRGNGWRKNGYYTSMGADGENSLEHNIKIGTNELS